MLPQSRSVLETAHVSLQRGDFRQALASCRPLIAGAPDDPEVCNLAGGALLGLGFPFEALSVASLACDLNPDNFDLKVLRTECLLAGGRFELARRSAERALCCDPCNPNLLASIRKVEAHIAELEDLRRSVPRPLLTHCQYGALKADFRSNYHLTPIIINSRDRHSCLERLVSWLQSSGYVNIVILDNSSTYEPLLDYFNGLGKGVLVYRCGNNLGPRALWLSGVFSLVQEIPFVYTDPDVLPLEDCPSDVVLTLFDLLDKYPFAIKAGLGIKIDDIPDTYQHKAAVLSWEAQFWKRPLPGNCYKALVDTTFALYRPGAWPRPQAVRAGFPNVVRHLPWYVDSSRPTLEDAYYADRAASGMSSWAGRHLSPRYSAQRAG